MFCCMARTAEMSLRSLAAGHPHQVTSHGFVQLAMVVPTSTIQLFMAIVHRKTTTVTLGYTMANWTSPNDDEHRCHGSNGSNEDANRIIMGFPLFLAVGYLAMVKTLYP